MKQKTNTLRLVSKVISQDIKGLEKANKQGHGNQHEKKTEEKFKKAVRLKLSKQWQDVNQELNALPVQLLCSLGWSWHGHWHSQG